MPISLKRNEISKEPGVTTCELVEQTFDSDSRGFSFAEGREQLCLLDP